MLFGLGRAIASASSSAFANPDYEARCRRERIECALQPRRLSLEAMLGGARHSRLGSSFLMRTALAAIGKDSFGIHSLFTGNTYRRSVGGQEAELLQRQ
jgi:hypothetical protein